MTTRIRPLTVADKPAVMRILMTTPEFKPSEVAVAEELIDSFLQDSYQSGYFISVAEIDAQIVGYVCYGQTPLTEATWDIYWIAVERQRQGQGIGLALMKAAETGIKEEKGRLVILETSSTPEYEKTRRFYLNQGYRVICQIVDFYSIGDDKVMLQKRLS